MAFLRTLPDNVAIYTNEPAAVYLYIGRGGYVLPDRYDGATAQQRAGFEEGVKRLQADINAGKAVMALFQSGGTHGKDRDFLIGDLYLAHESSGDLIYTMKP
jgi:hypothetical protein